MKKFINEYFIEEEDSDEGGEEEYCKDFQQISGSFSQREAPRVSSGRLSRGSEHDTIEKIKTKLDRKEQHITVTIVLYNTATEGVPSEEDIVSAIDDMENLYKSCEWNGKLSDKNSSFMNSNFVPNTVPFNDYMKQFPTYEYKV